MNIKSIFFLFVFLFGQTEPAYSLSEEALAAFNLAQAKQDVAATNQQLDEPPTALACKDQNNPNGPDAWVRVNMEADYAACNGEGRNTSRSCNFIDVSQRASPYIAAFTAAISAGSQLEACKAAQALSGLSTALNLGFGGTCGRSVLKCQNSCKSLTAKFTNYIKMIRVVCDPSDPRAQAKIAEITTRMTEVTRKRIEPCSNLSEIAKSSIGSTALSAISYANSTKCVNSLKDQNVRSCKTKEDLENYPDECAPLLCLQQYFVNLPVCKKMYQPDCTNAYYYNHPSCVCEREPTSVMCAQNSPAPGATYEPYIPPVAEDDSFDPGDFDFGDENAEQPLGLQPSGPEGAHQMQGGGSGVGGGSPLGSTFGDNAPGGPGKGPYNTDILGGTSGGGGGGSGGGGSYGAGGGGYESDPRAKGYSLKDFLPGGKGAKRSLAGKEVLMKNGITEANGLSNFQKVSNRVNAIRGRKQFIESP